MTAEIVRKFVWNNTEYCNVRYGDGTCVQLSGEIGQYTDEQWIQLALTIYDNQPEEPDPMRQVLMCCSDDMLVAEVIRRHLNIAAEGQVI